MIQRENMTAVALAATTITLTPPPNMSARVTNIEVQHDAVPAGNLKVSIDRKLIFDLPQLLNLNAFVDVVGEPTPGTLNIVPFSDTMKKTGLFPTFPIAAGESMIVTTGFTANAIIVTYDLYPEGEVLNTEPNGSKSTTYTLIQVASNEEAIAASGDTELTLSLTDNAFPDFPAGAEVPANMALTMKALFGSPVGLGDGAVADKWTTRLKFMRDREDIFDADFAGLVFQATATGNPSAYYTTLQSQLQGGQNFAPPKLFFFEETPEYRKGEELTISVTVHDVASTVPLPIGSVYVGMIFEARRA